jgi:hypothetical protein
MEAQRGSRSISYSVFNFRFRWVWVVNATPSRFSPRERPGTYCTRSWVGQKAGVDGCGKSRPHCDSTPGPSNPRRVTIPTELYRPTQKKVKSKGQIPDRATSTQDLSNCSNRDMPLTSSLFLRHDSPCWASDHTQTHTHTHLVGLLWTSDQSVAETSTWQHKTLKTERHPYYQRDSNPRSEQASGHRPTP